jgi:selenocysteine lyase/cysteine desulfurase
MNNLQMFFKILIIGTMDYSPYMTVPAALEFRRQIGGEEAIQNYTHNLAREGGAYLARMYGTEVLQDEDQMGSLVDVRLPIDDPYDPVIMTPGWWIDTFVYRYTSLFAPAYMHNGSWWVRHSAQIYNDMSDFENAAELFLEVCNEINSKNGTINYVAPSLRSNELI